MLEKKTINIAWDPDLTAQQLLAKSEVTSRYGLVRV